MLFFQCGGAAPGGSARVIKEPQEKHGTPPWNVSVIEIRGKNVF